jgi:hypothetical protein
LILLALLLPAYYFTKYLQRIIRPRESAGRLFLYFLANFMLVVIYTTLLVGLVVNLFPAR